MSLKVIQENSDLLRKWIERQKEQHLQYLQEHPDSLLPPFEKEIRNLGFEFEICDQIVNVMPEHKKVILPISIKYYQLAKERKMDNEQNYFMSFFHFKGFEEVIPMLLQDYYSEETTDLTRWFISDCFYQIRSKKYISEYLDIISNPGFGRNRQMIILLLGKLRVEIAISIFIELLEDEDVRLHAIEALGQFKREEFRCHFERFENSTHPGWRKYARAALKKLNSAK